MSPLGNEFCPCMGLSHAVFFQCIDCGQIICEAFDPLVRKCPICNASLKYPIEIESLLSARKTRAMQSLKPEKRQSADLCNIAFKDCNDEKCLKEWHMPKQFDSKAQAQAIKEDGATLKPFRNRKATITRVGKF